MKKMTWFGGVVLAALIGTACGGNPMVGGDCAPGFSACGNACCDANGNVVASGPGATPAQGTIAADSGSGTSDGSGDAGATSTATNDDAGIATGDDAAAGDAADGATGSGDDAAANGDDAAATADAATSDAATADAATTGGDDAGAADAGPLCDPGLAWCNGQCVSLDSDPDNCGACGHQCASYVCQAGMCQGQTTGDIVYLAHDYEATPATSSQGRELMNAVVLSSSQPVHVLVFDEWADATASSRVDAVLAAIPTQLGRTVSVTHSNRDDLVPGQLDAGAVDVLVVLDQRSAPAGTLANVGTAWATSLGTFTHAGGVLAVLDGAAGTVQEMPAFMTATGLLSVTAHTRMSTGALVDVVTPSDALGVGVISPYATRADGAHVTCEAASARVVYVATDPVSTEPVVVHKVAP